jgi:hypothetical protein
MVIRWHLAHWRIVTVVPLDDVGRPNGRQRCPKIAQTADGKRSRIMRSSPVQQRQADEDGCRTHRLSSLHDHDDDQDDDEDDQ